MLKKLAIKRKARVYKIELAYCAGCGQWVRPIRVREVIAEYEEHQGVPIFRGEGEYERSACPVCNGNVQLSPELDLIEDQIPY